MYAIILAGGTSSRMGENIPKALLQFGYQTMLEYQMDWLLSRGITNIIVSTSTNIMETYGSMFPEGDAIDYITEPYKLGTGGAIKLALDAIDDDTQKYVYIMNVDDFITDEDHAPLRGIKQLIVNGASGLLYYSNPPLPFSTIKFDNDKVKSFIRNPKLSNVNVSVGHYIFNIETLKSYLNYTVGELEEDTLTNMASDGELIVSKVKGWLTVNDRKQYRSTLIQLGFDIQTSS